MPQPIIAMLHGYVLGSGVEIALFCDIRIASTDVVFGMPEVELGILPAAGGTQTLPRILGLSGAMDMLLTGRRLRSQEALDSGLVSRIEPRDRLQAESDAMAQTIASFRPDVVRRAKQAVTKGLDMTLEQGLQLEWTLAKSSAKLSAK
jgi:enoyl-CoA hydratase/carnithine racemase